MQHQTSSVETSPITRIHGDQLLTGKVISSEAKATEMMIQCNLGTVKALRAFSCHTAPKAGDTVLIANTSEGLFVTDILLRPSASPAQQDFPHGLILETPENLSFNSSKDIEINCSQKTSITTADLSIGALKSRVRILDFVAHISDFKGRFTKLAWISDWAEQRANIFRQRFKRSDRKVEEQDMQKSGSLVQQVDKTASLRAEHTIIKARKDVQVDGKRIHMG